MNPFQPDPPERQQEKKSMSRNRQKRRALQAKRQLQVRELVEQAQERGYLDVAPNLPVQVHNSFRAWCKREHCPAITVETQEARATVAVDTRTVRENVGEGAGMVGEDPRSLLAPTPDLRAQLARLLEQAIRRSPNRAECTCTARGELVLTGVLAEDAQQLAQALLALWADARSHYDARDRTRPVEAATAVTPVLPAWRRALVRFEDEVGLAPLEPLEDAVTVPDHLSALLSKEQMAAFLGVTAQAGRRKSELEEQLRTRLSSDPSAKAWFFEVFVSELAVEPWELERLLNCSTLERKRWTADGKLPFLSTRSVFKSGRDLVYPVFDRRVILRLGQADLSRWRSEHADLVALRRRTGVQKARTSKMQNAQARQDEFATVEALFDEWERLEFPELAAVFRLAYWTVWASRWAKENQVKSANAIKYSRLYEERKDAWYARKDEAVALMARSSYAQLSFYQPEDADKVTLVLCQEHHSQMRQGFYDGKWDLYASHKAEITACPYCHVAREEDYYSLYALEVSASAAPQLHFSFHVPYPLGKRFLPTPASLPRAQHQEQEGLFRFGRKLEESEKILYREKDVEAWFGAATAQAQRFLSSGWANAQGEKEGGGESP